MRASYVQTTAYSNTLLYLPDSQRQQLSWNAFFPGRLAAWYWLKFCYWVPLSTKKIREIKTCKYLTFLLWIKLGLY